MTVEIWSDVACPWCYIGKRRFESALARFPRRDQVTVIWRSYQLNPDAPRQSEGTVTELLARKYGMSLTEAAARNAQVTALAAEEGLTYNMDTVKPGNTFDAHRLIHLGAARGLQDVVKERLLRAYFTDGIALGDPEALIAAVAEAGLDPDEAREVLNGDAYAAEVQDDLDRAASFGIRAVPFFVIDEKYGISGAQPADLFSQALTQAWAESHPLTMVGVGNAAVCDDESCTVPGE